MVENCNDNPWQAKMGRSSLSKYSNSMSLFVATSFFPCFHTVFTFLACLQSFKGLSDLFQGSIEVVLGRFCTSPIKIALLLTSLGAYWSNTTERFLHCAVFATAAGNDTIATSFGTHSCNPQYVVCAHKTESGARLSLRRR